MGINFKPKQRARDSYVRGFPSILAENIEVHWIKMVPKIEKMYTPSLQYPYLSKRNKLIATHQYLLQNSQE